MYKLVFFSFFYLSFVFSKEAIKKENGSIEINTVVDKVEQAVQLSYKYRKGAYLIYDCEAQHFVCADVDNQLECDENREKAFVRKKERLPCAVLKQYYKQQDCLEAQTKFMLKKKYDYCFARRSERFYRYQDTSIESNKH
jgi:hypothetical protein